MLIDLTLINNWTKEKKYFSNKLDIFINNYLLNNYLFFFITVNNDLNSKILNSNENLETIMLQINNEIWKNEYQTEFTYIVPEYNKSGNVHYHIIMIVKGLLNYNGNILKNLSNKYKINISSDSIVKRLINFKDIKNCFHYILKDSYILNSNNNLKYHFICISEENYHFWHDLDNIFIKVDYKNYFIFKHSNKKNLDIHELGSANNEKDLNFSKKTLLLIIQYFIYLNEIIVRNDFVYLKINNTILSYKKAGNLNWFKENIINIYNFLLKIYPLNFYGLDINDLILNHFVDTTMISNHLILKESNKFNFGIIEFNDGVYFMDADKFVKRSIITQIKEKKYFYTIKYYDKSYNWERQKKPNNWINAVIYVTNFKEDSNEYNNFCSRIANLIIKNNNITGKQKLLYIWGDSSTGKTTIIAKPLWKYFEKENIGIISGNSNFAYDYVINKELVIWDEAVIEKKKREEILKFLENEPIVANRKYKNQEILENIEKIALSNYSLNPDENKKLNHKKTYTDEAIFNRVYSVTFAPQYNNIKEHEKKMKAFIINIENEDPTIMIYCNKILSKTYGKNQTWYKKFLNEYKNNNIKELENKNF